MLIYQDYFEQNKYTKLYIRICERAKLRASNRAHAKKLLGYVEGHHIVPLSFDKSSREVVYLSAREHFVIHKVLIKCSKVEYLHMAKLCIRKFLQENKRTQVRCLNSRDYEYIRKICSECVSGSKNPRFGKVGTVSNKIVCNNGSKNKFVDDINAIPEGYSIGSYKRGKSSGITNGVFNSRLDIGEPMPEGYYFGSKMKGIQSKLLGRTVGAYSKERVELAKKSMQNFIFYTNGVKDIKIQFGAAPPPGFSRGRSNGTESALSKQNSLNDKLLFWGFSTLEQAENELKMLAEDGFTQSDFRKKFGKSMKPNSPKISTVLKLLDIQVSKGKPGPKLS